VDKERDEKMRRRRRKDRNEDERIKR